MPITRATESPPIGPFSWHSSCGSRGTMVIDSSSFTDIARHLHGISEGLLDGMKKVVTLNPETAAHDEQMKAEWLAAIECFVRVNQDVLNLAELLRALLEANDEIPTKPTLS